MPSSKEYIHQLVAISVEVLGDELFEVDKAYFTRKSLELKNIDHFVWPTQGHNAIPNLSQISVPRSFIWCRLRQPDLNCTVLLGKQAQRICQWGIKSGKVKQQPPSQAKIENK